MPAPNQRLLAILAVGLLCAPAWGANDHAPLEGLQQVGAGELRWLGMELYEARLLSAAGRFDGLRPSGPVALEITYRRNISSDRLVQTTAREWRRLGQALGLPGQAQVEHWLAALAEIWPDVAPGDQLIAVVEPGGSTHFHGKQGALGSIMDPEFGPAFLGIWLHPGTRAGELRAGLIGERP